MNTETTVILDEEIVILEPQPTPVQLAKMNYDHINALRHEVEQGNIKDDIDQIYVLLGKAKNDWDQLSDELL